MAKSELRSPDKAASSGPPPTDRPEAPLVVCWGEILWDLFPDDARLGGAPANVAFHLAQLGGPVALVSRVGDDDRGAKAIRLFREREVDVTAIGIDSQRATGTVGVEIENGDATYTMAKACACECIELSAAARSLLTRASAVCFGTLSWLASGQQAFEQFIAALPEDCERVCDLNLRKGNVDMDLVHSCLAASTIVKVNDREAEALESRLGISSAVRWLIEELDVRVVALTRGPGGSAIHTADSVANHAGFPAAPGGDNVGAGDAYTAALVHLLLRGAELEETCREANRLGSFVASRRGATPAAPAELIAQVTSCVTESAAQE